MNDGDRVVEETNWQVTREGVIVERTFGERVRYQLLVRDQGRVKFFINQWFATEEAAREFLDKLKKEVQASKSTP